jgi:cell division transport system ATP-binding protein
MILLSQVSKRYSHRSEATLDQVDLHVPPGQFLFLTGPSGAGKTTLLRLLFAAEAPSSGSVRVGGADLGRLKPSQLPLLRRKVGVIFQDFKLVRARSVFDNVALALRVAGGRGPALTARVQEVLAQVGLKQAAWARADTLSGGEQQRVAIARALVGRPPLLLADEPTGNLDPATALEVMRLLVAAHAAGATVLVATHDPKLLGQVRGARVVRLQQGGLREGGQ